MTKSHFTKGISGPSDHVVDDEYLHSPNVDFAAGRRAFVRTLGLGAVGAAALGTGVTLGAPEAQAQAITDIDILNFALNFEYLGAEFYLRAAAGRGLDSSLITGSGTPGPVSGGHQTPFKDRVVRNYANELAGDEQGHVVFVRNQLGLAAVARPAINLFESFTIAARQAGIINQQQTFDPFADDNGFLVAAFIFEDVCVTALKGAAPLISSKEVLAGAAGLLGTEAYQAGTIRSTLYARGLYTYAQQISDLRNTLTGINQDQGIGDVNTANIVPTDGNAIVATRTPAQVLAIAYGGRGNTGGLFFPNGVNGSLRSS